MSCWISTVSDTEADDRTRVILDAVRRPDGTIHNLYRAQSLRPHTITGHDELYRSVLHHANNSLPGWLLETIALATAMIPRCD